MAGNPQRQNEPGKGAEASSLAQADSGAFWEKKLMDRILAQDDSAMMELYDKYSSLVFNLAAHVLGDRSVAQDVVQEVFLHVWRNANSFDSTRGSLATWLAVMTRYRAIDILRKRKRECALDIDRPSNINLQHQMEQSEATMKIAALLPSMPVTQQAALGLAYFFGFTHSEISSRTGEAPGTVKSRIRLALEFLRKSLANREGLKYPVPINATRSMKRK